MIAAPNLRFTFSDYLLVDDASTARHEFLDGMILGMAGGTPEHARLAAAVTLALGRQLEGKRCAVFSEALRIRRAPDFAAYPDVSVVCGELARDAESAVTVTNPTVVVEVLSPSTAEYDSGEKLRQYQTIPSLRHIVLVAHDAPGIVVYTRDEGGWQRRAAAAGEQAELPAISCSLAVDAIFRDPLAD
jgi:Uma2 family endonuclease